MRRGMLCPGFCSPTYESVLTRAIPPLMTVSILFSRLAPPETIAESRELHWRATPTQSTQRTYRSFNFIVRNRNGVLAGAARKNAIAIAMAADVHPKPRLLSVKCLTGT